MPFDLPTLGLPEWEFIASCMFGVLLGAYHYIRSKQ